MPPRIPTLRFSPYAWAKLCWLRDCGRTEVGGFGISDPRDPFLVIDFMTVTQHCTWGSVKFEDEAVADFFDQQVDLGRSPESFGRIWIHTHPGDSAQPSITDEDTFADAFGRTDWSLMFILAKGGETYARLRFGVGPGGALEVPVEVDFAVPFPAADHAAWEAEHFANVHVEDRLAVDVGEDKPSDLDFHEPQEEREPHEPFGFDRWDAAMAGFAPAYIFD